ncbi:MAG TPA: VWA domain-containing protein [Candidatus Acidoferrales bacterium]|nr:VWA domain-containing protein [Candidatus Acidoferrales bacterium]
MKRVAVFAALVLVPVAIPAQDGQQASPTIQVATRLVQINVVARDRSGPVSTLTKDDFSVTDQGKPQTISVFSIESTPGDNLAAEPPRGEFSNLVSRNGAAQPGVTILLLDNLNTLVGAGAEPYETSPTWLEEHALANAKNHLLEYLKGLDPNERVAIYSLTDELHVLCDFTGDRAQLLAVVEKFDATSKSRREEVEPGSTHTPVPGRFNQSINQERLILAGMKNQDRARTTMDALRAIASHVAGVPGRKNLIWLTANLPYSGTAIARMMAPAQIALYPVDARGLLPRSELSKAMTEGIDADDVARGRGTMPAETSQPIGIDAMLKMADATGGRAFTNTNDLTGAIRHAVEDAEVSYTLGFYVEKAALDDKLHEIKVKVKRGGVEVRYPKSYFASKADPVAESGNLTRALAMQSPLESSAIVMRANIARGGGTAANALKVAAIVDIREMRLTPEDGVRKGSFDIYFVQEDIRGKVIDSAEERVNLNLNDAQYDADLGTGVRCDESVTLLPEATSLRLLVQDRGSSKIGTIIVPVAEIK